MGEEKGFTVHDRRRVKIDTDLAETKAGNDEASPEVPERPETKIPKSSDTGSKQRLPPVDFTAFALGIAQMALVHLGEFPEPGTGKSGVDLVQSRHMIDILDMLAEKTRGNLNEDESRLLQGLKSDLMLKYVHLAKQGTPNPV